MCITALVSLTGVAAAQTTEPADTTNADGDKAAGGAAEGEVIVVTGEAPDPVEPVTYDLSPDVIRKLPGSGNDAIKSLQTMPSVGRVPFGLGGLILRGTSPRDSNVFLDGVRVPLLYHFGGLASFYPSSLLASMSLQPGGYSARFGRGDGGIVQLDSRGARSDRWRVGSEVSMMDASLQADGPSGGWGAWSLAMRRSYIDALLPLVSTGSADLTAAPRYYDGQLRFDSRPWRNAQLTAMLFGSADDMAAQYGVEKDRTFALNTQFARFALRFRQRWGRTQLQVLPWIGVDRYHLASSFQTMTSADDPAGLRARLTHDYRHGSWAVGTDVERGDFAVSSVSIGDADMTEIARDGSYTNAAVWLEGMIELAGDRFALSPGLRAEHYGLAQTIVVDPRLTMIEKPRSGLTLRQSVGAYHQPPSYADQLWGNDDLRPSRSIQTSAGATIDVNRRTQLSFTGFYSELYDLAVDAPDAPSLLTEDLATYRIGAVASTREFIGKQFGSFSVLDNGGHGRVYGAEVIARYVGARGFAWLAYTYSRSLRWRTDDPDNTRVPWVLDQPHVVTAVGSIELGKHWRVGARVRVASGNPLTPLVGREINDQNEWQPIFGIENSERLPTFFQLDVRIDREWKRRWGTVSLFLDLQNATRRKNIEGRVYAEDYSGWQDTGGLPMFPSFGVAYAP